MSVEQKYESYQIAAGADFRTVGQHKAVVVAGTIAATADLCIGLIKSKPNTGENLRVGYSGIMKYYADSIHTAGENLTVTTSGFIANTGSASGTTVGRALVTTASGDLGLGMFNFSHGGPLS